MMMSLEERLERLEQACRQAHILSEVNTPVVHTVHSGPTPPTTVVHGAHPDWSAIAQPARPMMPRVGIGEAIDKERQELHASLAR